jgi:hypothetical protein
MISLASKEAGKQAKQAKTLKPLKAYPAAWFGLGLPSTSSRPLESFLHTTLGGNVHPLARISTKAAYEEERGVRLVGTTVLEWFSVSGIILRVDVGFGPAGRQARLGGEDGVKEENLT